MIAEVQKDGEESSVFSVVPVANNILFMGFTFFNSSSPFYQYCPSEFTVQTDYGQMKFSSAMHWMMYNKAVICGDINISSFDIAIT